MFKIVWSPGAQQNYLDILDYLSQFSPESAIQLDEKMDKLMQQLSRFLYLCPPSASKPGYRRCVVSKNYSVVYRLRKNTVYVVSILDNRSKN